MMDLKTNADVNAVQINYAENQTQIFGRSDSIYHQYLLQYSSDGKDWKTLTDKTKNKTDVPHDYIELAVPIKARYIKMTSYKVPDGTFAIAGLRVFGNANGATPQQVKNLNIQRSKTDPCIVNLKWDKSKDAIGYNIRFGTSGNKLYLNYQVFDSDSLTIRSLNSKRSYYFTIDAFNESGVTKASGIVEVK
jgi:xylan 1,4-beta-xylosidase